MNSTINLPRSYSVKWGQPINSPNPHLLVFDRCLSLAWLKWLLFLENEVEDQWLQRSVCNHWLQSVLRLHSSGRYRFYSMLWFKSNSVCVGHLDTWMFFGSDWGWPSVSWLGDINLWALASKAIPEKHPASLPANYRNINTTMRSETIIRQEGLTDSRIM